MERALMTSAEAIRPLSGRRVLIVEDEYFLADDLARSLARLGGEVVGPVPTREQALGLLSGPERIDLAVLDINLRGESAFPIADALAERGVPFLFATGYGQEAVPERFRHRPHWEKPFDPDDLARALPGLS
jgi:CheY-like chemotaxis protein